MDKEVLRLNNKQTTQLKNAKDLNKHLINEYIQRQISI